MTLDRDTFAQLSQLNDPHGVLSMYVNADPQGDSDPQAWRLRLQHQISALTERMSDNGSRERIDRMRRRIDALGEDRDWLLDPTTRGMGRALFAPLSDGEVHRVSVQLPTEDFVTCEDSAYIRPLFEWWSKGSPAGIAVAARDGLRIVDFRFGLATELATVEYDAGTEEWAEMKGPATSGSPFARHGVSHRELFESKLNEHIRQFLSTTHTTLRRYADGQEWEYLVVTGEPQLVDAVLEHVNGDRPRVVRAQQVLWDVPTAMLIDTVLPDLEKGRREAEAALVMRATETKRTARGLDETLAAIQQGQAEVLLMSEGHEWTGCRSADGQYTAGGVVPPGASEQDMMPEPHMGERLVELALRNGTEVAMLREEEAERLGDGADGLVALLRW